MSWSVVLALALTAAVSVATSAAAVFAAVSWNAEGLLPLAVLSGAAALVTLTAFVLLGLWLYLRVRQPLLSQLRCAETGICEEPEPRMPPELQPCSESIRALGEHLIAFRGENDALRARQRDDPARRRLEAILRDLSEGVVVCNLEHQVLLYNRVALWLLCGAGEIGLGRSLFETVEADPVRAALDNLLGARTLTAPDAAERSTVSLDCALHDRSVQPGRMTLVINAEGEPDGYVLTLAGAAAEETDQTRAGPHREFYDLDLFDRPVPQRISGTAELRDLNFIVFDSEATGMRPDQGDEIISLAGVRVRGGRVLTEEVFDSLVRPTGPIPVKSTRVHGLTNEQVAAAPGAATVLQRFRAFVGDGVLAAHNAAFDMAMLEHQATPLGIRFDMPVLCTLLLSTVVHDHAENHALDEIAARFEIPIPTGTRHTALGDALITAEVLVRLIDILGRRGLRTLQEAKRASARQEQILQQQTVG